MAESMALDPDQPPQFSPVPVPKDPSEYQHSVNRLADNIYSSYQATTPEHRKYGREFYKHEGRGSSAAVAQGMSPTSPVGSLNRSHPPDWEHPSAHGAGDSPARQEGREKIARAATVLAKLSPQSGWEKNREMGHEITQMSTRDAEHLRTKGKEGRTVLSGKYINAKPTGDVLAAHDAWTGKTPHEQALPEGDKRRKVTTFRNQLLSGALGEDKNTTVDFRQHDIAAGQLLNSSTPRGLGSEGRYRMFEAAHQQAADRINAARQPREPAITPGQLQAATWLGDREDVNRRLGGSVAQGSHLHAGKNGKALSRSDLGRPIGQGK